MFLFSYGHAIGINIALLSAYTTHSEAGELNRGISKLLHKLTAERSSPVPSLVSCNAIMSGSEADDRDFSDDETGACVGIESCCISSRVWKVYCVQPPVANQK